MKLCKVPNCTKMDRGRGFCSKHGNLLGLGGLKCTHEGCNKCAVSKGLCCEHGGVRRCQMKGCQKMERNGGFCNTHQPGGPVPDALPPPGMTELPGAVTASKRKLNQHHDNQREGERSEKQD